MRTPKMTESELVEKLTTVFSTYGYNGVTLDDLAKSANLNKASLYHFFPQGKEAMAIAALEHALIKVNECVIKVLENDTDPKARIKKALKNLNDFYDGGMRACLLELMNSSTTGDKVKNLIADSFHILINGFEIYYLVIGFSITESKLHAENTIVGIQGSLVLSRALNSNKPFKRQLKHIENLAVTQLEKLNGISN